MDEKQLTPSEGVEKESLCASGRAQQRKRKNSVFQYIAILFAAAFVLLLYTYLMERRQNELLQAENKQQSTAIQQSVSAVQSLQNLYQENDELRESLEAAEAECGRLSAELDEARKQLASQQNQISALDARRQAADDLYLLETQVRLKEYTEASDTYLRLIENEALFSQTGEETNGFSRPERCLELARQLIKRGVLTEEEAKLEFLKGILSSAAPGTP